MDKSDRTQQILLGLAIALTIRLIFMAFPYAFWIDMGTFRAWAIGMVQHGFANFYSSMWSDYPPGYLYVLWLTGKLYTLFDPFLQNTNQILLIALVKLTPAIADIGSAFMIWLILKPLVPSSIALSTSLFYAFNPVVIFVSVVWGQVDSVITFLMLLIMWLLQKDKFIIAGIIGAVSVIVKPQGLFLLPIFVLSQWYRRIWWKWLIAIAFSILIIWLMVLPFVWNQVGGFNLSNANSLLTVLYPIQFLYDRFSSGAATYPYASVNAFNIWAGLNWKSDSLELLGWSYRSIGLGLLSAVLVWIGIFLYRASGNYPRNSDKPSPNLDTDRIFLAAAVVMMAIFMFPTRMHERYIFYAIAFMSTSSAFRPSIRPIYMGVTATSAINIGYAFIRYNHEKFFNTIPASWLQGLILITAICNLGLFLALFSHTFDRGSDRFTPTNSQFFT